MKKVSKLFVIAALGVVSFSSCQDENYTEVEETVLENAVNATTDLEDNNKAKPKRPNRD